MEITEKDNNIVITPLSPKLSERESLRISEELDNINKIASYKNIGFNMSLVHDCTIDFIKSIVSHKNISLFNIQSDIFAILISMDLDKILNLYVSESDFINGTHKLINRKFRII